MDKGNILEQGWQFFSKWWIWVFYIMMGIGGKIGVTLHKGEKLSTWKWVGSALIAGFAGYLSSVICQVYYPASGPYVVPIVTLGSDKFVLSLVAMDWQPLLRYLLNQKDKEKKED